MQKFNKRNSKGRAPKSHSPGTARELALEVLIKVEQDQAYSNIALNQGLSSSRLSRQDSALATEIVYGTIQRRNTIDYFLQKFVNKGLDKLELWVRQLIRLSFYQIYYLDRIPPHAAVNEAVTIANKRGHRGISGMVNGVLRYVLRQKEQLVIPQQPTLERIALQHSHPQWMVQRWIKQFGEQTTEQICEANNEAPIPSIRVNSWRTNRDMMIDALEAEQLKAIPSSLANDGILVPHGGNMALTSWYAEGDISVQDESSMLVAQIANPQPGMTVLDCCAAPGGKTAHMAELMHNEGRIVANDIHEHKRELVEKQASRLQLTSIETMISDAALLDQRFAPESFDLILLDAPCTGLGVIRRKPEIKWQKKEQDIEPITEIQNRILESVHGLLKKGGVLVYSTCTLETAENSGMIEHFLNEHSEFKVDENMSDYVPDTLKEQAKSGMVQLLPQQFGSDGFFIARLIKI